MMEVVLLGTGTCVPRARRAPAGNAVRAGAHWLLVDAGSGTIQRLAQAGVDPATLDAFCLTHIHPDHSLDLVTLLFALNYTPGLERREPLYIFAPPGFTRFYEQLQTAFRWIEPRGFELEIREVGDEVIEHHDLSIRAAAVDHAALPAVAFRLADGHESVVFSGDSGPCDALTNLAARADLLVCEASFPDQSMAVAGHLTAADAGRIAARAGVGNLVLTHFYPVCDRYDMQALCARAFDGPIIVGEDQMRLRLEGRRLTVVCP